MITAIAELTESFAPLHGVDVAFENAKEERQFRDHVDRLRHGWVMEKTVQLRVPKAFTLSVTRADGQSSLVYIYDAAGEDFEHEERLATHPIEFHDAIWLVVDPLAEPGICNEVLPNVPSEEIRRNNPASLEASEVLGRVLSVLERTHHARVGSPIPVPIAVTVTKVDACGLNGVLPIADAPSDHVFPRLGNAADWFEYPSLTIRKYLSQNGLGNLVRMIETRFPKVAYFAAYALEWSDDGSTTTYAGRGVIAPLVWLLYSTDALCDTDDFDRGFVNWNWYLYRILRGREGILPLLAFIVIVLGIAGAFTALYFSVSLVPFLFITLFPFALVLIYIVCLFALMFSRFD